MSTARDWVRSLARPVFNRLGLDVRSLAYANTEETVIRSLLRLAGPAAVLDVGANVGQFARLVRRCGYRGTIVSFEALPAVHAALSRLAHDDPRWVIAPFAALGRSSGEIDINVSSNSVSSSVLPMTDVLQHAAPDAAFVARQRIPMRRLDEMLAGLLPPSGDLYLKIDTQGFEKEVLTGATAVLPRIAAMQLELSLVPLYEGTPPLAEMISFVEKLGYALFSLVPGFRDERTGQIFQADGFFVRKACGNA